MYVQWSTKFCFSKNYLSEHQLSMLYEYQRVLQEQKQMELNSRFQKAWQERLEVIWSVIWVFIQQASQPARIIFHISSNHLIGYFLCLFFISVIVFNILVIIFNIFVKVFNVSVLVFNVSVIIFNIWVIVFKENESLTVKFFADLDQSSKMSF